MSVANHFITSGNLLRAFVQDAEPTSATSVTEPTWHKSQPGTATYEKTSWDFASPSLVLKDGSILRHLLVPVETYPSATTQIVKTPTVPSVFLMEEDLLLDSQTIDMQLEVHHTYAKTYAAGWGEATPIYDTDILIDDLEK
jgi:hypothetical protein